MGLIDEKTYEVAERLRRVAENAPVGMALKDMAGRVLWSNPALQSMLGYEDAELRGMFRTEFTHPLDAGEDTNLYEELLRGERQSFQLEKRYIRKDGSSLWGRLSIFRIDNESDLTLVIVEDIEAHKVAEKELAASEGRFRTVIEQAPLSIHIFEPGGRSLRANASWNVLWDLQEGEEPEGHNVYQDEQLRAMGLLAYIEESKRKGAAVRTPPLLHDPAKTGREGPERKLEASVYPVKDEEGSVFEMALIIEDVTERMEAEARLRQTEAHYRNVVDSLGEGLLITDLDDAVVYANLRMAELSGYAVEEMLGRPAYEMLLPREQWEQTRHRNEERVRGKADRYETRCLRKDGASFWAAVSAAPYRDPSGEIIGTMGAFNDVTERREAEQELRAAEERYRALVENVPAVAYTQEVGKLQTALYVSPRIRDLTGYGPEDFESDPDLWYGVVHPDDRQEVAAEDKRTEETGDPFRMEYRLVHRDDRVVWVRDESVLVRAGDQAPLYWQGVMSDITEHKALEEQLKHQALHDPLTGLPNRILLEDRLRLALRRTKRRGGQVAVLFVDLDNFKVVNDSLGHEAGDRLLQSVSKRLGAVVRPEDTVARLGGDEFIFLLEEVGLEEACSTAVRILATLRSPISLRGRKVYATASIGIAVGGNGTQRTEDLLRDADLAMYGAKRSGKARYAVFEEGMNAQALERLELEQGLRRALERGEFEAYYQPKVSLSSGRVIGFEALLRWHHPERGLLLPEVFISLAEETGLIVPIGEWVLREACHQARELHALYPSGPPPSMCVNLTAKQFREPGLPQIIARVLEETELEPSSLFLEVTESTAMEDAPATAATFEGLKDLGVRAIIDDFGTGYSSLSYLGRFPVDYVKIDRSFVGGLGEDRASTLLAKGVIDLTHAFDLKVIAEGVETKGQLQQLREMGCDLAQGFYFSEPLTSEAAKEWLVSPSVSEAPEFILDL